MNAKSYHKKIVIPFINGIKTAVNKMIKKYLNLLNQVNKLKNSILPLKLKINDLNNQIDQLFDRNKHLEKTLQKIKKTLGHEVFQQIIQEPNDRKKTKHEKDYRR